MNWVWSVVRDWNSIRIHVNYPLNKDIFMAILYNVVNFIFNIFTRVKCSIQKVWSNKYGLQKIQNVDALKCKFRVKIPYTTEYKRLIYVICDGWVSIGDNIDSTLSVATWIWTFSPSMTALSVCRKFIQIESRNLCLHLSVKLAF